MNNMNKKGMVFSAPRDTISFFVGLVIFAYGIVPLLNQFKLLAFNWPGILGQLPFKIAMWIIAVAGIYVLIDGFIEPPQHGLHWALIVIGLVLFVTGLLPILHSFGVIGLSLGFLDNLILYYIIITVEGLLLLIGGLTEH
jgi:hypothetical protein